MFSTHKEKQQESNYGTTKQAGNNKKALVSPYLFFKKDVFKRKIAFHNSMANKLSTSMQSNRLAMWQKIE